MDTDNKPADPIHTEAAYLAAVHNPNLSRDVRHESVHKYADLHYERTGEKVDTKRIFYAGEERVKEALDKIGQEDAVKD